MLLHSPVWSSHTERCVIAFGYLAKPGDVFTHFPFIHGHVPLAYVGLMTFILIMSSVTMVLAVDAGHSMNRKVVLRWLGLTIVGGFMFLGSQAWEWFHFIEGSEKGAYVLADGRFARTGWSWTGVLKFHDGTVVEGAEAQALISTAVKISMVLTSPKTNTVTLLYSGTSSSLPDSTIPRVLRSDDQHYRVILVYQGALDKERLWIGRKSPDSTGAVDLVWVFVFTFSSISFNHYSTANYTLCHLISCTNTFRMTLNKAHGALNKNWSGVYSGFFILTLFEVAISFTGIPHVVLIWTFSTHSGESLFHYGLFHYLKFEAIAARNTACCFLCAHRIFDIHRIVWRGLPSCMCRINLLCQWQTLSLQEILIPLAILLFPVIFWLVLLRGTNHFKSLPYNWSWWDQCRGIHVFSVGSFSCWIRKER